MTVRQLEIRPGIGVALTILAAFAAGQRTVLHGYSQFACLIPFALALQAFWSNPRKSNTYLVVALFLSVDNAVGNYISTPQGVRYPIYLLAIGALIRGADFSIKRLTACFGLAFIYTLLIPFQTETFEPSAAARDVALFGLFSLLFARTQSSLPAFGGIDLALLTAVLISALGSELLQYIVFFNRHEALYLTYNSTKALIVAPVACMLAAGRHLAALTLAIPTLVLLAGYGTRMIPVALLVGILILLASKVRELRVRRRMFGHVFKLCIGIAAVMTLPVSTIELEGNRVTYFFSNAVDTVGSVDALRTLDPVRFDENTLFFNRNLVSILMGQGFGAALADSENLLGYISYEQFAFTKRELDSGVYYGLHDVWTDVGLRFGLVFVVACSGFIIRALMGTRGNRAEALILWVLVFCAFYSTAGLLLTGMFVLAVRYTAPRTSHFKSVDPSNPSIKMPVRS